MEKTLPMATDSVEEIYVTAITEYDVHGDGKHLLPVTCRFFLGEGRMGGRPLSSIEIVG